MVDEDPMPLEVLVGLVPLVKRGNRWPTKGQVVLLVGGQVGGGWWTADDVADYVSAAPSTCRVLLSQLENERVLLRDPGEAGERGQPRRYWVEVNPRWEDWRVAWRVPRRVVRQRAVLLAEGAKTTDLERFIARSYGARYAEISARLWARDKRRLEAAEAALSLIPWARDNGSREGARRAFSGGRARSGGGSSRAYERAIKRPAPQERSLDHVGDDETSPVAGVAPRRREGISISYSHHMAALRAVCSVSIAGKGTDRPHIFKNSDPWHRTAELVAAHGLEAVTKAVEVIEHTTGRVSPPPMVVEQVAELLEAGELPNLDEVLADTNGLDAGRRAARVASLEASIAAARDDGFEPDSLVAELAELVNGAPT